MFNLEGIIAMNIQKHPNVQFRPQLTLICARPRQIWISQKIDIFEMWIFQKKRMIFEMWIFRYVDNFAIRIYWLFERFEIENLIKNLIFERKCTILNSEWHILTFKLFNPSKFSQFCVPYQLHFLLIDPACSFSSHFRAVFQLSCFELNRILELVVETELSL